jgi:broad specificity phosphatase PhoE
MKPKRIFLIRHGESIANLDRNHYSSLPGHQIPLTDEGINQVKECGLILRNKLISNNIFFYLSPYFRTKQTYEGILSQLGDINKKVREEPRIRE